MPFKEINPVDEARELQETFKNDPETRETFRQYEEAHQQKDSFDKRKEDLQWCKDRALEYVEMGDCSQAYASFVSDINKCENISYNPTVLMMLMTTGMQSAEKNDVDGMRNWINGFN